MNSCWTKNCKTNAEREKRREQVKGFQTAFEELEKVLDDQKPPEIITDYRDPSWVHKQIAYNEYHRVLRDFKKLMKVK